MNPTGDPLETLAGTVAELTRRQAELERRVAQLETGRAPQPVQAAPVTPVARVPAGGELETRMGLTWVNRIGALTLVLGVAFFFKYAVDNQWVGEPGRVTLGVLAGLGCLGIGERFWRLGQRTFGHGVCGSGIAILFVSSYASAGFYHVLGVPTAFTLMSAVTVTACFLSLRYGSVAIATLGLLGGYLTPVVLSAGRQRPWFLLSYVLLLDLGALAIRRRRGWRLLEGIAFAATWLLLLTQTSFPAPTGRRLGLALFSMMFAALFSLRPDGGISALAQLLGMIWAWGVWHRGGADVVEQATVLLLAAALAAGQAARTQERRPAFLAGIGAVFLLFAAPCLAADYRTTIAWCGATGIIAWAWNRTGAPRLAEALVVALPLIACRLYGWDVTAMPGPRFAAFLAAAILFWAVAWWSPRDGRAALVYAAGHFHLLWILGVEVLAWGRRATPRENLASVESASISILVAIYAVLLIGIGVAWRVAINRLLGLALIAFVVGKLYLYDVWQLSRIYRFTAFGLLGVLLLLTSYLYSRFRHLIRLPGRPIE